MRYDFFIDIFLHNSWSHLFFRPEFRSDLLMEYLEDYDAIYFSNHNSDRTFYWNPDGICITYPIECYLQGKKNQKENILCVGFVTADLSWNFSVIWYMFREYFSTSDKIIHLCMLRSEWFIIVFYSGFQSMQCRNMAKRKKKYNWVEFIF